MAWITTVIGVAGDLLRRRDMGGATKALWTVLIILLPVIGLAAHLVARGTSLDSYVPAREAVRSSAVAEAAGARPADELSQLAAQRERGIITDAEFEQGKSKTPR